MLIAVWLALAFAPPGDYLAQGTAALDANQPAVAESFFRKAVEANPADLQSQFDLALVLGMQGKDAEAIAAYRKVLELKPALFEADLNLGILLLRDRQPGDAAVVLKEAAETKPRDYRAQLNYAQSLFDSGDMEQAEARYRQALEIDPKSSAANLGIARTLLKQNKLADSEPYYRTSASLDPSRASALLELGAEYDRIGDNTAAIAIFREFPANEAVAKRLTELLLATNNAAAAIPRLEAALQSAPTTADRLALINAYRQTGAPDKAFAQLEAAVAADGTNFELRTSYGRALREKRRFPGAATQFQAAAQLRPDSAATWNDLAGVLILAGRLEDGLAALDQVKALGKEIPGDFYLRAITLDKLQQKKPAIAAYQEFLAAAGGKFPDQEFLARQRIRIIGTEIGVYKGAENKK